MKLWDFPGSPVVKSVHRRGHGFEGTKTPRDRAKKKKKMCVHSPYKNERSLPQTQTRRKTARPRQIWTRGTTQEQKGTDH